MKLRADIAVLIRDGHSDTFIARDLGAAKLTVAKTRRAMGLPPIQLRSVLTLDQKWATHAQPETAGHMAWDGPRNSSGVPILKHHRDRHQARAVAFRRRYGRDPIGYVTATCEHKWCVADDHVADKPMREQLANQFAAIFGSAA